MANFRNGQSNRLAGLIRKPGDWLAEVGSEPLHPNAVPHAAIIQKGKPWPEEKC